MTIKFELFLVLEAYYAIFFVKNQKILNIPSKLFKTSKSSVIPPQPTLSSMRSFFYRVTRRSINKNGSLTTEISRQLHGPCHHSQTNGMQRFLFTVDNELDVSYSWVTRNENGRHIFTTNKSEMPHVVPTRERFVY